MRSVVDMRALLKLFVLGMAVLALSAPGARADELAQLYRQIMFAPQDVALNLRYAKLAEERGENRKSLAAYERVLAADPGNDEARSGLARINASLTPAVTRGRIEIGGRYETNTREVPKSAGRRDDFIGFAKIYLSDERALFGTRWRTDLDGYADLHDEVSAINYWRARAHTGPVFDLGGGTTLHIAPSGGISFLDAEYFYAEAALRLVFEQVFGIVDRLEVRAGYRDLDNSFSRTDGVVLDIEARETYRGILTTSDALVFQPFFHWRDASGDATNAAGLPTSFLMGDYVEPGVRLMYFLYPFEDVRLGARFTGHYRDYKQNITLGTTGRYDWYIAPEAELLFRNIVCRGCDLRLRYRYEQNFSNDDTQDYVNHSIIFSGIRRF